MTPRERVLTALRHKEPDRVPFDLGGSILTGITTTAYKSLRAHMDLSPMHEMRIMDIVQQLAFVDEDMARKLQTDVRGIFLKDPSDWSLKIEEAGKYSRFTDPWGIGWQMPKRGGYYYDMYHHPLKGITADDVDKAPWPNPLDPARVKGLKEEAMKIRDEGFAVMMGNPFGAGVFEMVLWLQGFEDGFANLLADKKLTHKLLDKMMDLKLKFWDLYLTEVGECVDVVIDGDDVGIQETPMLSREMYREYILARQDHLLVHQEEGAERLHLFPFLRLDLRHPAGHPGDRRGHPEPRAGQRGEDGHGGAQEGVRRPPRLLGRRRGHAGNPASGYPRRGEGGGQAPHRRPRPRRRLRLQHRPQHPARLPAREHHGHVGGRDGVREVLMRPLRRTPRFSEER